MSFKYQPRCKICASPIRNLIEERLAAKQSVSQIIEWANGGLGFSFSIPSIYRHLNRHFDYHEDVLALQNQKSQALVKNQALEAIATKEVLQTFMEESIKNVKEGKTTVDPRVGLESAKELNKMNYVYEGDKGAVYYLQQLIQINTPSTERPIKISRAEIDSSNIA